MSYQITLKLDNKSLEELRNNKFKLYGFKSVTSSGGALPVVWFKYEDYQRETTLSWENTYEAFDSESSLDSGTKIVTRNCEPIKLDETCLIEEIGIKTLAKSLQKNAITFHSVASKQVTCGLMQKVKEASDSTELVAMPILGQSYITVVPIEKVLLIFASNSMNTGTVILQNFSDGFLIDLTQDHQVTVEYDSEKSWVPNVNGTLVPANSNLVDVLIHQSSELLHHVEKHIKETYGVTYETKSGKTGNLSAKGNDTLGDVIEKIETSVHLENVEWNVNVDGKEIRKANRHDKNKISDVVVSCKLILKLVQA